MAGGRFYAASFVEHTTFQLSGELLTTDGTEWQPLPDLPAGVQVIEPLDDVLFLCAGGGFGAYETATATRLWWTENQPCPITLNTVP